MKVGIIGGGICGLYLAWKLAERRENVTVFEKKDKIGKEACSGLFSEMVLKFIPQSERLVENKIESVLIHFPKKTLKVKFSKTFLVMDHAELDRLVADLAQKAGAEIILNKPIDSLPSGFDRMVGCDGAQSFVRKLLGSKEPKYRLGVQWFKPEKNFSSYVEVWPTQAGFSWKIPRGEKTEYGIVDVPKEIKIDFQNKEIKSALIPQGFCIPRNKTITLCGDAAGLTKPWSGGGVIWGLSAAEILLRTFPNFLKYRREMRRFFFPQIVFSKIAAKIVYFSGFKLPYFLPKKFKMGADFTILDFMIR